MLSFPSQGSLLSTPSKQLSKAGNTDITIGYAGDCTFGTVNSDDSTKRFPNVYERSGKFDYPFSLVKKWFSTDDLNVVNFECTLTDATKTADKEWKFKGSAKYASIFSAAGISVVGLANNHSHDYLQQGFEDTLRNFGRANVPVVYQGNPFITTIRGRQVVVIADCTVIGENTTYVDGVADRVTQEIKKYKTSNSVVIVFMHWGSELDATPRAWQQKLGQRFIDAGADAVVGAHPHVLQGIERYRGKFIAYSLGNFAFGGNSHANHPETAILKLTFRPFSQNQDYETASIVPCLTTSTGAKDGSGEIINNYQPCPQSGESAEKIRKLILNRSASLQFGIHSLDSSLK